MKQDFPQACDSCGVKECHKSYVARGIDDKGGICAFLLDEQWPEYIGFIKSTKHLNDQILAPAIGTLNIARYDWKLGQKGTATIATLLRHIAMYLARKKSGAIRQKIYLQYNDVVAAELVKQLDYLATHLVISQNFLPFLQKYGVLGGRTYDVLMTQYPMSNIHQLLDAAAIGINSKTINDFRAPNEVLELEQTALDGAQKIITPHHGIGALFSEKLILLDWHLPQAKPKTQGNRIAFLGPTIARQGALHVREIAKTLDNPLIIFGSNLEGEGFWNGVPIEHRQMSANWLDDIGAIIHPAAFTNQPRKLLEAASTQVKIYATDECGLPKSMFIPISEFKTHKH